MRLLHRSRELSTSLQEREAYERSYGTTVDHVDVVETAPHVDVTVEPVAPTHVTTRALKQQFEERLAARRRRRHADGS